MGLLKSSKNDDNDDRKILEKCLEITDLGILLGLPFGTISLTSIADILSNALNKGKKRKREEEEEEGQEVEKSEISIKENFRESFDDNDSIIIDSIECPSLEYFYNNYMIKNTPVKLTGCMNHWPALKLWKDFGYIVGKAGCRTVPVEIGKHYAHDTYSQKLMKISEFVEEYINNPSKSAIGYLAQHQLFDQVTIYLYIYLLYGHVIAS